MSITKKHLLIICLLYCLPIGLIAQILHVEPLNWWVGMKNPNLQLLIHVNDIGSTNPSINYAGISIKKVSKANSNNYIFIDLLIAKNTKPGTCTIEFKKENKRT